jgi:redox-sensitive bicupin YhaK (pirin superfamily)
MAQLWVNLPAKHKMDAPRYQELIASRIPVVSLPDGAGDVRLIAGAFGNTPAAARTFSPVVLWDVRLHAGARTQLPLPAEFNAGLFVRLGAIKLRGDQTASRRQLALLSPQGSGVVVEATEEAELLVIGGRPLDESLVASGPFVMNTQEQIAQAVADYRAGRFGELTAAV